MEGEWADEVRGADRHRAGRRWRVSARIQEEGGNIFWQVTPAMTRPARQEAIRVSSLQTESLSLTALGSFSSFVPLLIIYRPNLTLRATSARSSPATANTLNPRLFFFFSTTFFFCRICRSRRVERGADPGRDDGQQKNAGGSVLTRTRLQQSSGGPGARPRHARRQKCREK